MDEEFQMEFAPCPFMTALQWARIDYPDANIEDTMAVALVYKDFLLDRPKPPKQYIADGNVIQFPKKA